jgi:hypothetical protein
VELKHQSIILSINSTFSDSAFGPARHRHIGALTVPATLRIMFTVTNSLEVVYNEKNISTIKS